VARQSDVDRAKAHNGFVHTPASVRRGLHAPALRGRLPEPIRSRPEFQLLMMDLAFPQDPFARAD